MTAVTFLREIFASDPVVHILPEFVHQAPGAGRGLGEALMQNRRKSSRTLTLLIPNCQLHREPKPLWELFEVQILNRNSRFSATRLLAAATSLVALPDAAAPDAEANATISYETCENLGLTAFCTGRVYEATKSFAVYSDVNPDNPAAECQQLHVRLHACEPARRRRRGPEPRGRSDADRVGSAVG